MNANRITWSVYAAVAILTAYGGAFVFEEVFHSSHTTALSAVLIGVVASLAGDVAVLEKKTRFRL